MNGGRSFGLEVYLPVDVNSLYALSMYNTLIGVAFDNGGEEVLSLSNVMLSYVILSSPRRLMLC